MKEVALKYGCNPNQSMARIFMDGGELPISILNGMPGYINLLDAFNAWQLVKELKEATHLPSATSFKHVSPTSAAVGLPLPELLKKIYFVEDIPDLDTSPLALAYARARGTDRMSSFGDFIALSDTCDKVTATLIKREISDGIIAPGYTKEAFDLLQSKKGGNYTIIQIDPTYTPKELERKEVFGITFEQTRNHIQVSEEQLKHIVTRNKHIPVHAKRDLLIALITLKYTQSNSVCYAYEGQVIGVGAGQQSRIHCTRLAGAKADTWFLRQHPKVLALPFQDHVRRPDRDNVIDVYINQYEEDVTADGIWQTYFTERPAPLTMDEKREYLATKQGVSLASDAFFPFSDNIKRAHKSGVSYIAQTGGSIQDEAVIATCNEFDIVCAFTGIRLFHH